MAELELHVWQTSFFFSVLGWMCCATAKWYLEKTKQKNEPLDRLAGCQSYAGIRMFYLQSISVVSYLRQDNHSFFLLNLCVYTYICMYLFWPSMRLNRTELIRVIPGCCVPASPQPSYSLNWRHVRSKLHKAEGAPSKAETQDLVITEYT